MNIKAWRLLLFFIIINFTLKAQTKNIEIDFKDITLDSALTKLITNQKAPLSFDPAILPGNYRINKHFVNSSLTDILDYLLSGTNLSYSFSDGEIIIFKDKRKYISISGHVSDNNTGEDIIGCSIYVKSLNRGIATNNYGYFALLLPTGEYSLIISQIGYKKKTLAVSLLNSKILDIRLENQTDTLKEITIDRSDASDTLLSNIPGKSLSLDFMKRYPSIGGDPDIMRSLQMGNGITRISEGSNSLFIRGGNKDQNLILLDEAPVYNPAHLLGLISIFNEDAINHVQVYKDEIPANFGGRLSSVIDTRMNEGNNREFHIKGGVSFLSARISAEGPIVKDKSSFLVTFRRGLTDLLNNYFQLNGVKGSYYDFSLKLNYSTNKNNRLFYSAYYGFDYLLSHYTYTNNWGNKTSTFRWNHLFNSHLFSNISAIYSNYNNQLDIYTSNLANRYKWETGIGDLSLKGDFTYYDKAENNIKFGLSGTLHNFIPGEVLDNESLSSINGNIPRENATEYAAYISNQFSIGNKLITNYGLRVSNFKNLQSGNKTFFNLEPRLSVLFKLGKFQQMHFAYNRNYQYLQILQNDELAFSSLETWIPSSRNIAPQWSDFYSLDYKTTYKSFVFSVTQYYKKMMNQLDLISHAQIILNPGIENEIRSGRSDAFGTEFDLSKTEGKFSGNLGYTWSTVNKKLASINNNKVYPANYDIPNNVKFTLTYQINTRIFLNSFFIYKTGRPVTLPVGYYYQNGIKVPIYEDKNASRLPDYNRLDLSLELKPDFSKIRSRHWQSDWIVSIHNVYNKKNILFYSIDNSLTRFSSGIGPSITYNFRF